MARQRLYMLRLGLSGDGVRVWGAPAARPSIVSVSDPDVEARAVSSQVLRIRWRDGVTLDHVLTEGDTIWRISEIAEVGQRRWLDLAVTAYDFVTIRPPADTTVYAPQTGYTLAKADGSAVQYLQIWEIVEWPEGDPRQNIIFRNHDRAAGTIPNDLRVRAPNGATGRLRNPALNLQRTPDPVIITADDQIIPESRPTVGYDFIISVDFDRRAARRQEYTPVVGDWIRILSTEEIPSG